MNPSELAMRNARLTLTVVGGLMVFGAVSYFRLPATEDPQLLIREAVITTSFPGMSAERVERLITKQIEQAVVQVPEIEEIRSVSQPGLSIVVPTIADQHFDLDRVWTDVRQRIERITSTLPDGASPPVLNADFGDVAVLTAALTAPDFDTAKVNQIAKHVRDLLYSVPGTKRVDLLSMQAERIFVEFENARLANLGVSPDELRELISRENIVNSGGMIDLGGRAFFVEPSGNFENLEAVANLLLPLSDGSTVRLADIASIRRSTVDPPEQKAYFNGEPAIILALFMDGDQNTMTYGERARERLEEIAATLPVGFSLEIVTFQAEQVAKAVYGVSFNVLQTLAIVLAVVVFFLGLRTGLIVGAIIPAVMLITLAIMAFTGMSLERMSLATLVIALGLLVDNGIVVAEDFKRRLEEGSGRDEALRRIGSQLSIPLFTSTLTTILVFLPLMMAQHSAGEYTRSISLVVLITLLTSWVLAMTVTPLLCHRFIRERPRNDKSTAPRQTASLSDRLFSWLNQLYETMLRWILRHRALFLGCIGALWILAGVGMGFVPQKFFPDSDRAQLIATIDLPADASSRTTDAAVRAMMRMLRESEDFPHIVNYAAYVGFGGPRFVLSLTPIDPAPNRAFFVFNVDDARHLDGTEAKLRRSFETHFPELRARVAKMFLGPSDSTKLEYQIRGPDADYLFEQAAVLEAMLAKVPGAIDVRHDWENRIPTITVRVDPKRARRADVTSADVAAALEQYFSGRTISEFRERDETFPIVLRAGDTERNDIERMRTVAIFPAKGGAPVTLQQVANIGLENRFARIAREDLSRAITVEARNERLSAEDMDAFLRKQVAEFAAQLAPGFTLVRAGVIKESAAGQAALTANIPLCFASILVLLIAQFNSFRRVAIIALTLPLILIGAVAGLALFGQNFGFMIILALYALVGILMNNAIVLIDRIDIDRTESGLGDFEAVVSACVRRLRPIVMATLTTVVGVAPLVIVGDALFAGMAAAIGLGLLVGTVLTLGVVPALYTLFFRINACDAPRAVPQSPSNTSPHVRSDLQPQSL